MMLIGGMLALLSSSALGVSVVKHQMDRRQPNNQIHLSHVDVEKFRESLVKDFASQADNIIDLIVADVEKLLNEHAANNPSFIQEGFKSNVRKSIKNGVISILKHMLPFFETWIADAVKPPVTTPMVYSSLVKPIGKSIFGQIYQKFHMAPTEVWEMKDDELFDVEIADGEEDAEVNDQSDNLA